ncbi:hypothetical protein O6H91_01G066000 [Diphasiastrum complanatum]|uniref:Uncharacterized protein n=1 Tax=Diphasiastrum complanatum TaxID=34168 RepID=A0ACC2ERW0_DIPCM|nr:hypothetical protein O6H91_01G066000 [Diphasiastrum complanatum]
MLLSLFQKMQPFLLFIIFMKYWGSGRTWLWQTFKAAYRRMARRYHPDVCAREEAQECTKRFIVLQEAYETLSDPWRRASYDRAMTNSLYSVAGGAWKREIS